MHLQGHRHPPASRLEAPAGGVPSSHRLQWGGNGARMLWATSWRCTGLKTGMLATRVSLVFCFLFGRRQPGLARAGVCRRPSTSRTSWRRSSSPPDPPASPKAWCAPCVSSPPWQAAERASSHGQQQPRCLAPSEGMFDAPCSAGRSGGICRYEAPRHGWQQRHVQPTRRDLSSPPPAWVCAPPRKAPRNVTGGSVHAANIDYH